MDVFRAWLVGILSFGLLAGCAPAPSPYAPLPSPTCTPEAGGDAYPCTDYENDEMVAKDNLYAEAEAVYRKFLAEDERVHRAGGVTKPTPVLSETLTGDYLKGTMEYFMELHAIRATAEGGTYKIVWFKRVPGESMDGSVIALKVCTDTSSIMMGARGVKAKPGLITEEIGYFAQVGSSLRLTASQFEKVAKC